MTRKDKEQKQSETNKYNNILTSSRKCNFHSFVTALTWCDKSKTLIGMLKKPIYSLQAFS